MSFSLSWQGFEGHEELNYSEKYYGSGKELLGVLGILLSKKMTVD